MYWIDLVSWTSCAIIGYWAFIYYAFHGIVSPLLDLVSIAGMLLGLAIVTAMLIKYLKAFSMWGFHIVNDDDLKSMFKAGAIITLIGIVVSPIIAKLPILIDIRIWIVGIWGAVSGCFFIYPLTGLIAHGIERLVRKISRRWI